jgi:endothelin-converting enzyme/putative endopeptidase
MNPEIRPQDDLFGHVNGGWFDAVVIPADRSSWGPGVQLQETTELQVHAIISELAERISRGTPETEGMGEDARKIANLYASFMDELTAEQRGLEPVRSRLQAVSELTNTRQLAAFLGEFERTGGASLFRCFVTTDDGNSGRYLVNIEQGGLGLPDESYYRDEKFTDVGAKYAAYLTELFTLAEHREPAAAAQAVLELETRLAAGHWERAETRDIQKIYNLTSLDELIALSPEFDWATYIAALGGSPATIAETIVLEPSYLTHMSAVLAEVPISQWRTWAAARVLRAASPFLSEAFVSTDFEFYGRVLNGTPELRPRWKRAVAFVESAIGEAVGKEYVARHFPPSSKSMIDELVGDLLQAFRGSISQLTWLTEATKERACDKLAAFRSKIGYPDRLRDYSALQVSPDDLLGNARAAAAFETDRQLAKIGSPVDHDEWYMLPQTVDAYYNAGTNEICFPAAILQDPFFSPDGELAENYGGIGGVIGHEIGHGFDDKGAQYDGAGNLNDWWTPTDKAAFELKSKALVAQYNGFSPRQLPGQFVNGALTVSENIGDLGGVSIAYKAYLIALGTEDVTADARAFFMNFAYCFRYKLRIEQEEQWLTTSPHAPAEFRANIVRNLDEFHETFATTPGDGLWLDNEERVRIW